MYWVSVFGFQVLARRVNGRAIVSALSKTSGAVRNRTAKPGKARGLLPRSDPTLKQRLEYRLSLTLSQQATARLCSRSTVHRSDALQLHSQVPGQGIEPRQRRSKRRVHPSHSPGVFFVCSVKFLGVLGILFSSRERRSEN